MSFDFLKTVKNSQYIEQHVIAKTGVKERLSKRNFYFTFFFLLVIFFLVCNFMLFTFSMISFFLCLLSHTEQFTKLVDMESSGPSNSASYPNVKSSIPTLKLGTDSTAIANNATPILNNGGKAEESLRTESSDQNESHEWEFPKTPSDGTHLGVVGHDSRTPSRTSEIELAKIHSSMNTSREISNETKSISTGTGSIQLSFKPQLKYN